MSHLFAPVVLREYDIRGQIGKNLSAQDAYALGRAFPAFVKNETANKDLTICVGRDGRLSSPALYDALVSGLMDSGVNVLSVGLGPTPMLYFSVKHLNADAGIMVTGSHNPPDYNGFKMTLNSAPVFGQKIQTIGNIAAQGQFPSGAGTCTETDVREAYTARLMQDLNLSRKLKIAWDAGNGAAGEILTRLSSKIEGEHVLLYETIDGTFPNHHPDPTVDKNLEDLRRAVLEHQCDLGVAFDGDGDRIGVVDENGTILRCDTLIAIYAREVLKNHPGATIIGDVKCSQTMFDEIERLGGKPVMWKTGHSVIKDKMREMSAPLAGELSGHIFFGDKYYGFDDALYCAVRLLNEVSGQNDGLSGLTSHLPKLFNTPEIRIDVPEEEKFSLVARVRQNIKALANETFRINDIDGLRVNTPDGWWLLRASNTQPALVARMESNNETGLSRLQQMVREEVKKLGYTPDF